MILIARDLAATHWACWSLAVVAVCADPEAETAGGRWVDAETLDSGGLQQDAETGQASSPGGADASYRKPEFIGYVDVRDRRIGHEHLQ